MMEIIISSSIIVLLLYTRTLLLYRITLFAMISSIITHIKNQY